MAGRSVPLVNECLKGFKKRSNLSNLKGLMTKLYDNFRLTLKLGTITLHTASVGKIQEAMLPKDIAPSTLTSLMEEIVGWYKKNDNDANWTFDLQDLRAISKRNIKLNKDLYIVAGLQRILSAAEELLILDINITILSKDLAGNHNSPAARAELCVQLKKLLSLKKVTSADILAKIDAIEDEGTYALEDLI